MREITVTLLHFCQFNNSSPIQTITVGSGITPDQPYYKIYNTGHGLKDIFRYPYYRRLGISPTPEELFSYVIVCLL